MRKIISKEEEGKKRKRNQFIVGGILIFIMISSMLGYALQSQISNPDYANVTSYNGIDFVNQDGFWAMNYREEMLVFTYLPSQIAESNLANLTKDIDDFSNKPLYIFSEDYNAESEIRINLFPFASSVESEQDISRNCEDNFIIIQQGNESVRQEGNCIFISGQEDNLIKLIDNVLFEIFWIRE